MRWRRPASIYGLITTAVVIIVLAAIRAGYLQSEAEAPATIASANGLVERPKLHLREPANRRQGFVRVLRVVDGDTLVVGKNEHVRLIGINIDEVPKDYIDPESSAWRAALFVQDLLSPDAQVRLEYDAERNDNYDRTLAYAYLPDGRMLNEVIMENGWAKVLRIAPNTKHAARLAQLESQARAAGLGRWAR